MIGYRMPIGGELVTAAKTVDVIIPATEKCIALKRLYVHESIYDSMCDEIARLASDQH